MAERKLRDFKTLFFALLIFGGTIALVANTFLRYSSAQQNSERVIEDRIPKHLPIRIKIKPEKEKAAKDLNNGRWHHDLTFEVKNTGDKPIYYLNFILDMPEITDNGISLTFIVHYGERSIFGEWKGMAQPDDKPILPNETVTLKIPDSQANGWDNTAASEMRPQPKRLSIIFMELNFGDGTGFYGTDGRPKTVSRKSEQKRVKYPGEADLSQRRCNHAQTANIKKSSLKNLIGGGESANFRPTSFRSAELAKFI